MAVQTPQKVAPLTQRPFTVAEYDRMIEAGILLEDERIELIDRAIVTMSPIGVRHVGCVNILNSLLTEALGRTVIVSVQNPVHLGEHSEPQPDVTVLRPRGDSYSHSLATAADILLLIEVAETSLDYDRTVKVPLYARAGIPEVWVINLAAETVEVYTEPGTPAYQSVRTRKKGDTLTPTALPDLTLPVDQLFI